MLFQINPDDTFPSSVCRECTDKLIGFNHFASQCEKSQAFLVRIKSISLQDDTHLQCLKSEFELGENEIKIKFEKNDASTIISNNKTDGCTWVKIFLTLCLTGSLPALDSEDLKNSDM